MLLFHTDTITLLTSWPSHKLFEWIDKVLKDGIIISRAANPTQVGQGFATLRAHSRWRQK